MTFFSRSSMGWRLGAVLTTALIVSPALAAPPELASLGSALQTEAPVLQKNCVEVGDQVGELLVQECLIQALDSIPVSLDTPRLPNAMRHALGAELQWMPQLLPDLDRGGERQGGLRRRATLADGTEVSMGAHAFVAHVETLEGSLAFRLDLEGHSLRRIEGEVSATGDGRLTFTEAKTHGVRTLEFVDGVAAPDQAIGSVDKSRRFYMGCYIDTPAFDPYYPNACYAVGTGSSLAVFKVFLPYTPSAVVWLTPSSSCSSLWCSAPISAGQTVYGYAYWVINGIPTGPVSAQAIYEYEPGFWN